MASEIPTTDPAAARQRWTAEGSPKDERCRAHQFYTPGCIVRISTEVLEPYHGRVVGETQLLSYPN